jgi:hypothetical protein
MCDAHAGVIGKESITAPQSPKAAKRTMKESSAGQGKLSESDWIVAWPALLFGWTRVHSRPAAAQPEAYRNSERCVSGLKSKALRKGYAEGIAA